MNILEDIFIRMFTADTYSCIKGRGIHAAADAVKMALKDEKNTQYCLKLDVKKFYPSVDHDILKQLLRRKFKDNDLLWLLDEIIESAPGLPIGNYLSQFLATFYLNTFDHWIKEEKRAMYYCRYMDDVVILAADKPYLHALLSEIRVYWKDKLKLDVKDNYQVFLVESRGINFLGYIFRHGYVLLRPSIKRRFARMLRYKKRDASVASYYGWVKYCNGKHLLKKLLHGTGGN
jgi:retron-type reverse transcriptase